MGGTVAPASPPQSPPVATNPPGSVVPAPSPSGGILGDIERECDHLKALADKDWAKRQVLMHVITKALLQAIEQESYDLILQALRAGLSDL